MNKILALFAGSVCARAFECALSENKKILEISSFYEMSSHSPEFSFHSTRDAALKYRMFYVNLECNTGILYLSHTAYECLSICRCDTYGNIESNT